MFVTSYTYPGTTRRWANVDLMLADGGPTLNQRWANVSCFLQWVVLCEFSVVCIIKVLKSTLVLKRFRDGSNNRETVRHKLECFSRGGWGVVVRGGVLCFLFMVSRVYARDLDRDGISRNKDVIRETPGTVTF